MSIEVGLTGLPNGEWLDLDSVKVGHRTIFQNGYMKSLDGRKCEIISIYSCKTKCRVKFDDGNTFLAYNTDLRKGHV